MIVAERSPRTAPKYQVEGTTAIERNLEELEWDMVDGRLTEPSDGKIYRLREAIAEVKRLGRPLTDEEMRKFEI